MDDCFNNLEIKLNKELRKVKNTEENTRVIGRIRPDFLGILANRGKGFV